MNRLLLFFLFFAVGHGLFAKRITPTKAQHMAVQFLKGLREDTRAAIDAREVKQVRYDSRSCYVFNVGRRNGFIVVSTDDRMEQILGYATTGRFDTAHLPADLQWWLACYDEQMDRLPIAPATRTVTQTNPARARIEPLVSTRWDQGKPYNLKTPKVGHTATYTGCVATATAQLLYYHRCPTASTTAIPSYITSTKRLPMPQLPATTFDWTKMRPVYEEDATGESADEVAKLMLYCGQAMKMDYNIDGSGAYVNEEVFSKYFGFAKGTREVSRSDYTLVAWEKLIYNELEARRPVLYTGGKVSGAHAFVCDGYDGNGYFHINWGWGGQSDGYSKLSILNPSDQGAGSSSGEDGYTLSQTALLGLSTTPVTFEKETPDNRLTASEVWLYQTFDTRKKASDNFNITNLGLYTYNLTAEMQSFELNWALYRDETQLQTFSAAAINNLKPEYRVSTNSDLSFGANLTDGTYRLVPVCRLKSETEWSPCIDADLHFVELELKGLRLNIKLHNDESDKIKVNDLTFHGKLRVNRPVEVRLSVSNEGRANNPELYLFVNGKVVSGTGSSIDPGQTGEVSLHFTPSQAGVYRIRVCQTSTGRRLLASKEVTITAGKPAQLELKATVTNANATTLVLNDNALRCHVDVTNKGTETYADPIVAKLYKVVGEYGYGQQTKSQELTLNVKATAGVDFEFDGLEEGERYFLILHYLSEDQATGELYSKIYTTSGTNGISTPDVLDGEQPLPVFNLRGERVASIKPSDIDQLLHTLPRGIYIIRGRKYCN